jgi:hypothetical protein
MSTYLHVAYVLSHATECHVQLVLCNYTNLQLHVSHATEFQLQTTIAKPKISSSVIPTLVFIHMTYIRRKRPFFNHYFLTTCWIQLALDCIIIFISINSTWPTSHLNLVDFSIRLVSVRHWPLLLIDR